ncbi:hypothetical protein E4U31_003273 [Claviceps sp. LM219 group G6]|nr:hypothetical protein E4U31_003273 [Claviceps sp. LM219 group G6]
MTSTTAYSDTHALSLQSSEKVEIEKSSPNYLHWLEVKHYTIERTNSPMTVFEQRKFGLFRRVEKWMDKIFQLCCNGAAHERILHDHGHEQ